MAGIGCGYVALGGLMGLNPQLVKRAWWEYRGGHIAPCGLTEDDACKVAVLQGFRLTRVERWQRDRKDRPTLARWIQLRRATCKGRRFLVGSNSHWVGVFLGQAPAVFDTMGGSRRMRVTQVLELTKARVQAAPELAKLLSWPR